MDRLVSAHARSFEQALINRVAQNVNPSHPWLPPVVDGQNAFAQFCATQGHRTNNSEQDLRDDISAFVYANNFGNPAKIRIVDTHDFVLQVQLMTEAEIANFEFTFRHSNGNFSSFRMFLRSYFQDWDHRVDELLSIDFAVCQARWRALLVTFHSSLQPEARREFRQVREQLAQEDRSELYGIRRRDHVLDRGMGQWVSIRNGNVSEEVYQAAIALRALREAQYSATRAVERILPLQPRAVAPANQIPHVATSNNSVGATSNSLNVAGAAYTRPITPLPACDRLSRPTQSSGRLTNKDIPIPGLGYRMPLPSKTQGDLSVTRGDGSGTQRGRIALPNAHLPRLQGLESSTLAHIDPLGQYARQAVGPVPQPSADIVPLPPALSGPGPVRTPSNQPVRETARPAPYPMCVSHYSNPAGWMSQQSEMATHNLTSCAVPKQPRTVTPSLPSSADPNQDLPKPQVETRIPQFAKEDAHQLPAATVNSGAQVASTKSVNIGCHSVPIAHFQENFKLMCGDVVHTHAASLAQNGVGPSNFVTSGASSVAASASSAAVSNLPPCADPYQGPSQQQFAGRPPCLANADRVQFARPTPRALVLKARNSRPFTLADVQAVRARAQARASEMRHKTASPSHAASSSSRSTAMDNFPSCADPKQLAEEESATSDTLASEESGEETEEE